MSMPLHCPGMECEMKVLCLAFTITFKAFTAFSSFSHPKVFDNTPSSKDGTLASGDEITAVNGTSVKGKTKVRGNRENICKMFSSANF